jgi:hypothetical protein
MFKMTSSSDHEEDAEKMVRHLSPNANKIYHLSGTQKFELPKHSHFFHFLYYINNFLLLFK